jgi:hypothetical protein
MKIKKNKNQNKTIKIKIQMSFYYNNLMPQNLNKIIIDLDGHITTEGNLLCEFKMSSNEIISNNSTITSNLTVGSNIKIINGGIDSGNGNFIKSQIISGITPSSNSTTNYNWVNIPTTIYGFHVLVNSSDGNKIPPFYGGQNSNYYYNAYIDGLTNKFTINIPLLFGNNVSNNPFTAIIYYK